MDLGAVSVSRAGGIFANLHGADFSVAQILFVPREANSLIYLIFSLGTLQVSAKKRGCIKKCNLFDIGDPNQNRTGVLAVRGRCPRPLDDGTITIRHHLNNLKKINLQEVFCNFIKNPQLLLHMV